MGSTQAEPVKASCVYSRACVLLLCQSDLLSLAAQCDAAQRGAFLRRQVRQVLTMEQFMAVREPSVFPIYFGRRLLATLGQVRLLITCFSSWTCQSCTPLNEVISSLDSNKGRIWLRRYLLSCPLKCSLFEFQSPTTFFSLPNLRFSLHSSAPKTNTSVILTVVTPILKKPNISLPLPTESSWVVPILRLLTFLNPRPLDKRWAGCFSKKQCVNLLLSAISARWDDAAQWKEPNQTVQRQNESARTRGDKRQAVNCVAQRQQKQLTYQNK